MLTRPTLAPLGALSFKALNGGDRNIVMRVKVECTPPLPSTKAWFIVPPVETVSDVKEALCYDLPGLQNAQTAPSQITLYLDGFELLDATSVDVVRDGDLLTCVSF